MRLVTLGFVHFNVHWLVLVKIQIMNPSFSLIESDHVADKSCDWNVFN